MYLFLAQIWKLLNMNDLKKKISQYAAATGAMLALAPVANASVIPGTITGGDGNTVLNQDEDFVFIDLNNDGVDDFMAYMYTSTDTSEGDTYSYKAVLFGYYGSGSSGLVDMEIISSPPFLHKYDISEPIGPLAYPSNFGVLSLYTSEPLVPKSPQNASPDINNTFLSNGTGFVGVSLGESGAEHYGWIQVDVNDGDANFINCALEQVENTPITAGSAVPLLPIASALGLGLIGAITALRKRNKKQQ
jgi:hypothetical protein